MQYYELLYIISATEDMAAAKDRVRSIIEDAGLEILRHEEAGRFKLAYTMNHVRQGIYYLVVFRGEPRNMVAVEATLRLEQSIIRSLISRSAEVMINRPIKLATFQEPAQPREESRPRLIRRPLRHAFAVPTVVAADPSSVGVIASPSPVVKQTKQMSEKEIDEEIARILEEKIL